MTSPSPSLALPHDEVHVWHVALDVPQAQQAALSGPLSVDERARAQRFHFERDRRRYVVTRGVLRTLLGRYLNRGAEEIRFDYTPDGKPELAPGPDEREEASRPLHFNVSHSHERSLVAITSIAEIGVDVERVRPVENALALAERFFSEGERADLTSVGREGLERTFFRCWTRKEAYVKALGPGIRAGLDRFRVSILEDRPAEMLWIDGDPGAADRWRLEHVECDDGYLGAVAVEAADWRLVSRRWTG